MGRIYDLFMSKYNYTDFHELNLDWLIAAIKQMEYEIENFVSINAVKYADPIQWDITKQYEKNTIVIDAITGTAYISRKPVPMGVALSNTNYWNVVFDLGRFITLAAQNFANSYESLTTTTATMPTPKDGWVVWDSTLYKALNDIHVGDMYVVDGNIEKKTVEDFFNAEAQTRANEDSRIELSLTDLITSKVDVEAQTRANEDERIELSLTNLITSQVGIVNGKIGDLNDLHTTNKDDLVSATNEVADKVDNLILETVYYNIVEHGADDTGVNDCLSIINDGLASGLTVYIPRGRFKVSGTIHMTTGQSIVGANANDIANATSGSVIIADNNSSHVIEIDSGARFVTISNLLLDRNVTDVVSGDGLHVNQTTHIKLYNITSQNNRYGFYLSATGWSYITDCVAQLNFSHGFMYQNTSISGALQWQTRNCLSERNNGSGFVIYGIDNTYHVVALGLFDGIATYANGAFGINIYGGDVGVNGYRITNAFLGNDAHGEIRVLSLGAVGGMIENCYLEIAGAAGSGRDGTGTADPLGYGIYVFANSKDVTISGCHIVSCQGDGIINESDTTSIIGCDIHNNGLSGSGVGIRQNAGTMVITGNNIHDNPDASIAFATNSKSLITCNKLNAAPVLAGGSSNIVVDNNVV